MSLKHVRRAAAVRFWICAASSVVLLGSLWIVESRSVLAQSQVFNSGSTGADGPLNITAPGLTYFDPASIPNHHAGDTIFNFTTITIGSSSQLRLDSRVIPGPVYWLATGDVNIAGNLDLSGQPGHNATSNRADRSFSVAGAGGFGGGPGGGSGLPAEPGSGPAGGIAGTATSLSGHQGVFSGSQYLIPLVGGSGGGGSFCDPFGPGGGGGGGAVLIASSTSINVSGTINGAGGSGGTVGQCPQSFYGETGGGGSGGAIRLVATSITVTDPNARIYVTGGQNIPVTSGFARFEAFQLNLNASLIAGSYTTSTPFQVALPQGGPSFVKVISVNGVPITTNPFSFPDATITTSNPIPIVIQGVNIPPGAIPTLTIVSETGPDQVIKAPALAGTLASSTSTVKIAYPPGGSQGLVRATWSN